MRTRRRWRWAAASALLAVAALATGLVPTLRRGWENAIPSSLLVLIAPPNDSSSGGLNWTAIGGTTFVSPAGGGNIVIQTPGLPPVTMAAPPPAPLTPGQRMTNEVWSRLRSGGLWDWQARRFVARYIRTRSLDPAACITLPKRWPLGEPIRARVARLSPAFETAVRRPGMPWQPGKHAEFGPVSGPADTLPLEIRLEHGSRPVYRTKVAPAISLRGAVDTFLDPVDSPEANDLVRAALNPRVVIDAGEGGDPAVHIVVGDRSLSPPWPEIDFGVVFRVEVVAAGRTVGSGQGMAQWSRPVWKDWEEIDMAWIDGGRALAASGDATIIVRGDPALAGRAYMQNPFDKPTGACWTGSFEVPARQGNR